MKLVKSKRYGEPIDWRFWWRAGELVAATTGGLALVVNAISMQSDAVYCVAGLAYIGCSFSAALPFALGAKSTFFLHSCISVLFAIGAVVFLASFLLVFLPFNQLAHWSEHSEWGLLWVLFVSGIYCLFVGAPLSLVLALIWLGKNR
jgi:hypothetical protein